jgi:membrane dipeptidase
MALSGLYKEMNSVLSKYPVSVSDVVDHIDYIVKLVGPDYVGLGSDFDGVHSLPSGLEDVSQMPNITRELVNRGYSEENIKKILGGNFMRVFKQVCG